MGFPAGYTEVLLPKLLISTLSIFGLIRKLILTMLSLFGISDFLEPETDPLSFPTSPSSLHSSSAVSPPVSSSTSSNLIREMLPVSTYVSDTDGTDTDTCCAVCLYDFEDGQEIRRMRNCQHIFHKSCVDRWIDHDRKTCPLCRAPFVPRHLQEDYNRRLWDASGILDFYSEYFTITGF